MTSITNKLHGMGYNLPNTLRIIYETDKLRMEDENKDELEVLEEFKERNNDVKYFLMLEKKGRKKPK